jgi:hypothetical protein
MERFKLTLLIIVMCLLGSKAQAMEVNYDASTTTLTITLDKGEYLYQQVEENNLSQYYETADKVIIKTNTTDVETISNLAYLVPNDFTILNKFKKATTMDLHSVNYLFRDVSLKGLSLKYVRLRDNIKNIQASWFKDAPAFEDAYSYSKEGDENAYCVYCNSHDNGGKIGEIFKNLESQFSLPTGDDHILNTNSNNNHLYVLVHGKINSSDVSVLCGSGLQYSAIDLSLLNATYVDSEGKTDYANFSLSNANGKLKSIILPSDMDVIADNCLENCNSLKQVIIPDGVTSIGVSAFDQCKSITSINIPEGCKTIKEKAFAQTCLQAIKLPSTLESIGDNAFTDNKYITSITFPTPKTTLEIGSNAFLNCYNLRDIYITDKAPTIKDNTFTNTQLGQNPNGQNLTDDGSVTIDNYRTNGQDNPIFLHYPNGKGSEYGDNEGADNRASQYHLTGKDGVKYPKEVNGDKGNGEANEWYEHHSGWAQFVFAAPTPNTETPIPVPEQYNAGRWYTMCFPFNLTRKQIEDTFGSGTEVCNFQYVEKEQIGEMTVYSIRFNEDLIKNGLDEKGNPITPGSQIITKADQPYMIHPSQKPGNHKYQITDGDRWEYKYKEENGQSEKTDQLISFDVTNKKPGSTKGEISEATTSAPAHVKAVFQGNYEENKLIPYGVFFLGGNEYYKIEAAKEEGRTKGKLNKFTAYVQITDEEFNADKYIANLRHYSQPNQAKIIYPSQWGEDDMSSSTTTAILPVHVASKPVDMENARIYNLQGQLVGTGAEALKSLHRGIYVMNGKKYVIR